MYITQTSDRIIYTFEISFSVTVVFRSLQRRACIDVYCIEPASYAKRGIMMSIYQLPYFITLNKSMDINIISDSFNCLGVFCDL